MWSAEQMMSQKLGIEAYLIFVSPATEKLKKLD